MDFLKRNKEEVLGACLYEFDQQAYERVIREEEFAAGKAEGREEGRKEGREEGRRSFIYEWVRAGKLSRQEGAAELHQTEDEFLIEMNAYFREPPEGAC